jgi:hypothetical protein
VVQLRVLKTKLTGNFKNKVGSLDFWCSVYSSSNSFFLTNNLTINYIIQIRHQGRNQNGRSISFSKPFTVRDPLAFAAAGQNLPQANRQKIRKFPDMAPVFNLQAMLEAEAEKLRMKVEEASLMAAKAAEEAEEKVKMIAEEAMKESGANAMDEEEVEKIVS